jgi:hypothetical protein
MKSGKNLEELIKEKKLLILGGLEISKALVTLARVVACPDAGISSDIKLKIQRELMTIHLANGKLEKFLLEDLCKICDEKILHQKEVDV